MRKRGLFPAAAPRRGYNPTHPGAKRASFAAAPAARPRRRPPCTRPAGKAAAAPARAARRIWPRSPLCRRCHPAAGERPARAPAPATGPACPPKRAAPFFRRAAAQRAPRLCPAETAASPRPVCLPEGRCPRHPGPCRPPRGVPAAAGVRPDRARVCPRPPAAPPGVCPPRGDQIPGRGLQETAAPSRVNFREIRDPGYSPPNSKQPPKNGRLFVDSPNA